VVGLGIVLNGGDLRAPHQASPSVSCLQAPQCRESPLVVANDRHRAQRIVIVESRSTIATDLTAMALDGEDPAYLVVIATEGELQRFANRCMTLSHRGGCSVGVISTPSATNTFLEPRT
jgi:hypothetical protein